ncbi:hypothetical protein HAX54_010384 [Datura stramonium]|uniref:Uncharacterized protein n=1 Tax=Datura stramonium TaxID=4076 RepID=A0ABS8TG81_DATST|nr:hypothetical protein [Datura stramonium]
MERKLGLWVFISSQWRPDIERGGWFHLVVGSDGKERRGCDVVGLRGFGLPALMVVFWVVAVPVSTTAVAGGCGEEEDGGSRSLPMVVCWFQVGWPVIEREERRRRL